MSSILLEPDRTRRVLTSPSLPKVMLERISGLIGHMRGLQRPWPYRTAAWNYQSRRSIAHSVDSLSPIIKVLSRLKPMLQPHMRSSSARSPSLVIAPFPSSTVQHAHRTSTASNRGWFGLPATMTGPFAANLSGAAMAPSPDSGTETTRRRNRQAARKGQKNRRLAGDRRGYVPAAVPPW